MTWRETMPMNEQDRKLQSKDGSSRRELIWPQVAEGSEPKALPWTLLQTRSWLTHKNNRLYLYEHEDVQKIRQESSCHRWKSDDTEIHRVASTCTPHACRGSQGIVSTSCAVFSCILSEDFTQENFTHNQNAGTVSQWQTRVTVHPYKGLLAVTRRCSCSAGTFTSLIFLNREEASHKPATASEATMGWELVPERNTGAHGHLGLGLAKWSVPSSPTACQSTQN